MTQVITVFTVFFLTMLDQVIKSAVTNRLAMDKEFVLIRNIFQLRYIENSGAIFGSFQSGAKLLAFITAMIILVTLYLLLFNRIKNKFLYVCLVLVVSGGTGNLIDRITKGYVVDYLEPLFMNFAIFNFADCLVTVGAFSMAGYLIFDMIRDMRKAKE